MRFVTRAIKLATFSVCVVHFLLTLLYVFPPNPVKVPLVPVLDATVGVYARQNWSLFAPNPISSDQALLAKCLSKAELAKEGKALLTSELTDGWSEVSAPLWAAFQRNRFTAYDRLNRPQTNTLRSYISGGTALAPWDQACRTNKDKDACETFERGLMVVREAAAPTLQKIGSAFCMDRASPTDEVVAVALRARVTPAKPWSEHRNPEFVRESRDISLGIYPLSNSIGRMGLFNQGGN